MGMNKGTKIMKLLNMKSSTKLYMSGLDKKGREIHLSLGQ